MEPQTPFSTPKLDSNPSPPASKFIIFFIYLMILIEGNTLKANNNSFIIDETNTNLLGDWIWKQTSNKKFLANRFKPNLSFLSTESTIDSDNLTLNNEHNNNSFTTHFSGNNNSFNNSGKIDFNTPSRLDSSKLIPEVI